MKLPFYILIPLLFALNVNAETLSEKTDISRFHIKEELTPARMEYFINNPANADEYNALEEAHYDMKKIACYAAEHHPERIDDIFSSYNYRWIPRCEEWSLQAKVPEFKALDEKYIQLSGVYNICGTITQDIAASMASYFIKAGRIPDFGKNNFANQKSGYENFLSDMDRWTYAGVWEKEQYETLQNLKQDAASAIANYYETQFKISKTEALEDAFDLLKAVDVMYLRRYSSCAYTRIPNNQEIDTFLANANFDFFNDKLDNECSYNRPSISNDGWVAAMLQTAIVQHRSLSDIQKLISHLSNNPDPYLLREPLHQAAPHYPEALALLLEISPRSVNEKNAFGKTVLMYAVQYNNIESVKLLFNNKVDVNAVTTEITTENGGSSCNQNFHIQASARTPLMYAAWYSIPEILQLLLNAGADKKMVDSNKKTACDYLDRNTDHQNQHEAMRALLCES